jgi:hypothetical protein
MGHQGGKYGEEQRPNCDCLLFGVYNATEYFAKFLSFPPSW